MKTKHYVALHQLKVFYNHDSIAKVFFIKGFLYRNIHEAPGFYQVFNCKSHYCCQLAGFFVHHCSPNFGNVNALSVSIAEVSRLNNFNPFNTHKISQKGYFSEHFQIGNYYHHYHHHHHHHHHYHYSYHYSFAR